MKSKKAATSTNENKDEKSKDEPAKLIGRRNYYTSDNKVNKIPLPKKEEKPKQNESTFQKSYYGKFRQGPGQDNDQAKKDENKPDKTYTTGFYRKAHTKPIDYNKLEEKAGQESISKFTRRNERATKDDNNDKYIPRGRSYFNIHSTKKEDPDNKKNENVVIKREAYRSNYNPKGDAPTGTHTVTPSVTTTTTTTTMTKVTSNNSGGAPSAYSRKRQDNNANTAVVGLEIKVEEKTEKVEKGIRSMYKKAARK
jgi:hypothetical protein